MSRRFDWWRTWVLEPLAFFALMGVLLCYASRTEGSQIEVSWGIPHRAAAATVHEAEIYRIVDCDTVAAWVYLTPDRALVMSENLRVRGINAPEITGPEKPLGEACVAHLAEVLGDGKVHVHLHGRDKYGRPLATVILPDGVDLSRYLVRHGWALPYEGEGAMPRFDPEAPYPLPVTEP